MSINIDRGFVSRTHVYKDNYNKEVVYTDYCTNIPDCSKRILFEGDVVRSIFTGQRLVIVRYPSGTWRALSNTETLVLSEHQSSVQYCGTIHDTEHRDLFSVYDRIYNLETRYKFRQGIVFKNEEGLNKC